MNAASDRNAAVDPVLDPVATACSQETRERAAVFSRPPREFGGIGGLGLSPLP